MDDVPVLPGIMSDTGLPWGLTRTYTGSVGMSRRLGRRSSAEIRFATERSWGEWKSGEWTGVRQTSLRTRVERRIGPFTSLRVGYGIGVGQFGSAADPSLRRHDIDGGVDYVRPLSFATATTLMLSTGSSVLTSERGTRFRLTTTAALERRLARRWSARVEYGRPIQYVAGFREPLLSDTVGLSTQGRITRAVSTHLSSRYARGSVGLDAAGSGFATRSHAAGLAWQVLPAWRIEIEGHYAVYRFDSPSGLPVFVPDQFVRRGLRAGLAWSSPLGGR